MKIAIIGLGYVGLPLAVAFAEIYSVVGIDINELRIRELQEGYDSTLEIEDSDLQAAIEKGLTLSNDINEATGCSIFIVTIPTPIDQYKRPVLTPMISASEEIGRIIAKNSQILTEQPNIADRKPIIIYESTVYPGVTEDKMVPILELTSGLKFNQDFFVGYSPERINPGDKEHTVTKILKITSGSTPEIAEVVDQLYKSVIIAGTYKTSSIKVAEAAKVIENTQRDINIAFINELAMIFSMMNLDTHEILEAAGTKWNFLNFKPGLVGGHCIGVDPYYLAQKAQEVGYNPELILAGRRINDGMGKYVAIEVLKLMIKKNMGLKNSRVLILGFAFKENCPDFRNTRVIDIYHELKSFDLEVDIFDPWVNADEVMSEYGIDLLNVVDSVNYSAIILAVAHKAFLELNLRNLAKNGIIYDVKGVLDRSSIDARL
jgi:UDP-N-acetyl-D-galactosamine dehydrogenase